MQIAAAQTPVEKDIAANGAAIREALRRAAEAGIRLVLFCEGALSGYAKAQIERPEDWRRFDWAQQERELRAIAATCAECGIFAVVGGAHRLDAGGSPHNCLYVISDSGALLTRYDKRLLSHSEISDWYAPGAAPVTFDADGYRFGLVLCIEVQFPEIFAEYERLGADAVLFASYGMPEAFQIALRAHAGLNCLWVAGATPAQKAPQGPAGVIGPDGKVIAHCPATVEPAFASARLDRTDPRYDIALTKARPWRAQARAGEIYRQKWVDDARSRDRSGY